MPRFGLPPLRGPRARRISGALPHAVGLNLQLLLDKTLSGAGERPLRWEARIVSAHRTSHAPGSLFGPQSGRAVETHQPNPAALLEKRDRPKIERKPVRTIDASTTAEVFDAARERRLFIPVVLAALCGLRRSEITALLWRSVDLDLGQFAVVASPDRRWRYPERGGEERTGPERSPSPRSPSTSYAAGVSPRLRNC